MQRTFVPSVIITAIAFLHPGLLPLTAGEDKSSDRSTVSFSDPSKPGWVKVKTINSSITAIDDFVPWFTVLVVIIAAAIIIGMVIRSFSGSR